MKISESSLHRGCESCNGEGQVPIRTGFIEIPFKYEECTSCDGTGFKPEVENKRTIECALENYVVELDIIETKLKQDTQNMALKAEKRQVEGFIVTLKSFIL